jgi:YggT family protein
MNAILTVLLYLYSLVFAIISYALLIRIGLYYFKVSPFHQISQLVNNLTNPLVNLSKKVFDLEKNRPILPYNVVITLLIIVIIKYIIGDILFYRALPFHYLLILIVADLVIMPLNLLFFAILIRAVMSWVRPDWHHPVQDILVLFTEPLLKLGRYILPSMSGFDFSPLVILLLLQLMSIFISASLPVRLI